MNYLLQEKEKENNYKKIILEAIYVGIYTLILYCILSFFINNPLFLFFLLGFIKHFLGDFIQLHTFFCNYGYACTYYFGGGNSILRHISERKEITILIESILEGILFLFICLFLFSILLFERKWYWIFFIGFFIHISMEKLGVHRLFCKYRCSLAG
jgi:hypothetical protein